MDSRHIAAGSTIVAAVLAILLGAPAILGMALLIVGVVWFVAVSLPQSTDGRLAMARSRRSAMIVALVGLSATVGIYIYAQASAHALPTEMTLFAVALVVLIITVVTGGMLWPRPSRPS